MPRDSDFWSARTSKCDAADVERVCSAEATLGRIAPHRSALGITRIADVTGLDNVGIPTVMVMRPGARNLSVTQGKGISMAAAKVSGLMEAAEHYMAERAQLSLRWGSQRDLATQLPLADPEQLPRYHRPFLLDSTCLWVEGREIATGEPRWLPYELVHLDYRLPLPAGSGHFLASSNGLASGNATVEALCHALFELIERDATTLFYASGGATQASCVIDLNTIDDPTCQALLKCFERAEAQITIWETTSDLGVASFLVEARPANVEPLRPLAASRGMGAHALRDVALRRALTEAAQSRLTSIVGSRDDIAADALADARKNSLEPVPLPTPTVRDYRAAPDAHFNLFEDELLWVLQRIRERGLPEPIWVDLSQERFPVQVVRVVAPVLEGISEIPGYRPGARSIACRSEALT